MTNISKRLTQLKPFWGRMYPEIKNALIGAEILYETHLEEETVPKLFLASPYILILEREFIQFFKHKFPKYLKLVAPDKFPDDFLTNEQDLKKMLKKSERIGLGHFINWMTKLNRNKDDELLFHLNAFTNVLDPEKIVFNKFSLEIISLKILKYRKYCVHISKLETWIDAERLQKLRELILTNFNDLGKGLLPLFIELESNVLKMLSMEK